MLLAEIKEAVKALPPREEVKQRDEPLPELGGQSPADVLGMIKPMATSRSLEEVTACLVDKSVSGTRYKDLLANAKYYCDSGKLDAEVLNILTEKKPHLPFFIASSGTDLLVASTKLSTDYYRALGRSSPQDKDIFCDYYRTDTPILVGLEESSLLGSGKDVRTRVFENALGAPDAMGVMMTQHTLDLERGKPTPTSMIAGNVGEAVYNAVAQNPSLRLDDEYLLNAPDSITHLFLGDGGTSEAVFKDMADCLELEIFKLWVDHFKPTDRVLQLGRYTEGNLAFRKKMYGMLLEEVKAPIKLTINVIDNGVAISRTSKATHPMGDAYSSWRHLINLGIAKYFECDGTNPEEFLQTEQKKLDAARDHGIVLTRYTCPRPGSHSYSNFTGFGKVDEKEAKWQLTVSPERVLYHQNTDPFLNTITYLVKNGYASSDEILHIIEEEEHKTIQSLVGVLKTHTPKKVRDLKPVMAWSVEGAQQYWDSLLTPEARKRREELWTKGKGKYPSFFELSSRRSATKLGAESPSTPDGHYIKPIQAENYALADAAMLTNGRLFIVGQDLCDLDAANIEQVIESSDIGLGGINFQTSHIQALLHIIDPKRGRNRVIDNGISEHTQNDIGLGIKRAFGDNCIVYNENAQFNDYNVPNMSTEQTITAYQRSNGNDNVPQIYRHSSGWVRGDVSVTDIWGKPADECVDGAGSMYHTAYNFDVNQFPGLVVIAPNTARAVQMAYRNAIGSRTPTLIMLTEMVMKGLPMMIENDEQTLARLREHPEYSRFFENDDGPLFDYGSTSLPLEVIDPLGTHYAYLRKDSEGNPLSVTDHTHIIFSFGEYVPPSEMVAKKLEKDPDVNGMNVLVIDYNTLNPRNKELPFNIFQEFKREGKKLPGLTITSGQSEYGFGSVIKGDITNALQQLQDHATINHFHSSQRKGALHENQLTNPPPVEIYELIKKQHQGFIPTPYQAPGEMRGIHNQIIL